MDVCIGITAYGIGLRTNSEGKVIVMYRTVIDLGTKVWMEGTEKRLLAILVGL